MAGRPNMLFFLVHLKYPVRALRHTDKRSMSWPLARHRTRDAAGARQTSQPNCYPAETTTKELTPEKADEVSRMQWLKSKIDRVRRGETTKLDLEAHYVSDDAGHRLTEFPVDILELENLTELNLSGNDIRAIPEEIVHLNRLETLSLARNRNIRLPPNLAKLTSLRTLQLSATSAYDPGRLPIPPSVVSLDISSNVSLLAADIVDIVRRCEHLRSLNVFGSSVDLRVLRAAAPELSFLSAVVGSEKLPSCDLHLLAEWEHLTRLRLQCSASVLLQISTLHNLEELEITLTRESNAQALLGQNPDIWLELASLRELGIIAFNYKPRRSPADIVRINVPESLRSLSLYGGILPRGFPKVLHNMTSLKRLILDDVALGKFPAQVLDLSALETLRLTNVQINAIPSEIRQLRNLKELTLSRNPIRRLPSEIGKLHQLEIFRLSESSLTSLPAEFSQLRALTTVGVDHSPLKTWPSEIMSLDRLTTLTLSNTGITEIPSEIDALQNLELIDLGHNSIREIPRTISNLKYLRYLIVTSSEVAQPPAEIAARGVSAIQEYFLALSDASVRLLEAKLILVGEGAVGKTSLAHKLVSPKCDLEQSRATIESTRGISIRDWSWITSDGQTFKVNIWDFGGQEIYHSTHQFFLTRRSLYVFVWDARKEDRLAGFDYWLSIVRLLSGDSPIIIVLNKADERIKEIDQRSLAEKFRNIVSFHKVSALQGLGMADLTREIQQTLLMLPHVGDLWPARWNAIRRKLEADAREYIDREEYLTICSREGLPEEPALVLSQYLHDLGAILHFQDDPLLQRIVVLKPEWGTDAVYAVLDTQSVQRNRGRFSLNDLRTIWSRTRYPPNRHPELLQLMARFELCFRLGTTSNYVAPELLEEQSPSYRWDLNDNLRFEYRYDFMPAGIVTRLIARVHNAIERDYYWKNGLVLCIAGARAVVIAEPLNRKIRIAVNGAAAKDALSVVRHEMNQIHKTLYEPNVSEMIPCSCSECCSGDPFYYSYQLLLRYYAKGNLSIMCNRSINQVSVAALLNGVVPAEEMARDLAGWSAKMNQAAPTLVINNIIESAVAVNTGKNESSRPAGPWASGSFYLVLLVMVLATLGAAARLFNVGVMLMIIAGAMLLTTIVGALQLRQDERLSEKTFLSLMTLAFRQLPLLNKFNKGSEQGKPPEK